MSRLLIAALAIAALCSGCSSNAPSDAVDANAQRSGGDQLTTSVTTENGPAGPSAADLVPAAGTDGSSSGAASSQRNPPRFPNPGGYLTEMQSMLEKSMPAPNKPPTLEAIHAAIALGDEGRAAYPDDENLLRAAAALRYRFLPLETDELAKKRRLELGGLARMLVERNKEDLSDLGNMPGILLLEEAVALITDSKQDEAWTSIKEARSLGFSQTKLLLLNAIFEPLAKQHESEISVWLKEDVAALFREQKSFPFDFSLKTLNGEPGATVSLADLKGKLVVVDIWGTWCGPCRITIPDLVALQAKHKDDLVVVGINFEEGELGGMSTFDQTKAKLTEFTQTQPITYACVYGTPEVAAQIPEFGSFPTLIFIDRDGKVRLVANGYQPAQVLDAITSIMKTG